MVVVNDRIMMSMNVFGRDTDNDGCEDDDSASYIFSLYIQSSLCLIVPS